MKKYLIPVLIILLTISCFSGCNSNNQKKNLNNGASSQKTEQGKSNPDNEKSQQQQAESANTSSGDSDENAMEKVDATDLNALQSNSFAYINKNGYLVIRNMNDKSEKTIISNGFVYDYGFNYKDNKITYIIGRDTDFTKTNAVIYDVNLKQRDVIIKNTGIKAISWSPSGKYIALTEGAGPGSGFVRIYNVKNKTWLKVPSQKGDGFEAIDFRWNTSSDILALEMLIYPKPESPVDGGESFSLSVYFPEKNNSIKNIVQGNSNYGYDKFQWIDNETLSIRKNNYDKEGSLEYYKVNINSGNITKVPEDKSDPLIGKIPKDAFLFDKSLSSDSKLLLYSSGGGSLDPTGEISLWDMENQTQKLICHGRLPKWIVNGKSQR